MNLYELLEMIAYTIVMETKRGNIFLENHHNFTKFSIGLITHFSCGTAPRRNYTMSDNMS